MKANEKAKELIDKWGKMCAGVEAWKMITFDMPPSKKYWQQVKKEIEKY